MVYGRLVKAPQRLELNICTEVEAYCMNNAKKTHQGAAALDTRTSSDWRHSTNRLGSEPQMSYLFDVGC